MKNFVEYTSLILWGIYFLISIYREVRRNEDKDFKMILKKPFHFIRIDNLFFLGVFIFYNRIARDDVLPYLFLFIVITNIVYLMYDLVDNYGVLKWDSKNAFYFVAGVFVLFFLGIYYFWCKNGIRMATILLAINIFIPSFVSLIRLIKKN